LLSCCSVFGEGGREWERIGGVESVGGR
jgi:hypothetical protein